MKSAPAKNEIVTFWFLTNPKGSWGMVWTQTPIKICFWSQHYEGSHLALFWKRVH